MPVAADAAVAGARPSAVLLSARPRTTLAQLRGDAQQLKIHAKDFRVGAGDKVNLRKWPTLVEPYFASQDEYREALAKHVATLSLRQQLHYADGRHALLVIFQGMDAAGKDGVIRHVMSGVNPAGCEVVRFAQPSAEELAHDFLWRAVCRLPPRGRIGIFNRSYYEEVLVVRVHPAMLEAQNLPHPVRGKSHVWRERYRSITALEAHLCRNGTQIVKIFLHLSKREQEKRFLERIDDPHKNWKFSQADILERGYWTHYRHAYEDCLAATSSRHAPWYIVPADDKDNARLIGSQILIDAFDLLELRYPKSTAKRRRELKSIRKQLESSS